MCAPAPPLAPPVCLNQLAEQAVPAPQAKEASLGLTAG